MSDEIVQVIVSGSAYEKKEEKIKQIGTVKYKLPMINSYVIELPKKNIGDLKKLEGVEKVEHDAHITAQMNVARDAINAKWANERGYKGRGIGIAVLDTGIYPHRDLSYRKRRIIAFKDFINKIDEPYDDNGHGTHVSGILGGDGVTSFGRYMGVAPECHLIGVKVLDKKGSGNISDVLAGLQWVIDNRNKYNIRIVNISVGTDDENHEGEDSALVRGVNAAWDYGLVVVVAAGNKGPDEMSITTPGISRKVITVGSSDDNQTVNIYGDLISDYSGRGPTIACVRKPDVVAPGSNIMSCNADVNYVPRQGHRILDTGYISKSGTSMATPMVSGAIALLLSKYQDISNKDIKIRLKDSTNDLGFSKEQQGWGMIDIKKLLELGLI